ncbi:MAG: ribosome biogenesis GTP-binding protein YihA/YsxC [Oscillospiraceae bacterium]|jgi:GTP-binding protein|nr:ribosome biogenesis GTP-binding protein YihA/YsxC [Oscillospiraceae bacterium]
MNWNKAALFASYGQFPQIPPKEAERAEIVFSGRSNVGKSSLINKLLNRKSLARVSAKPGKTVTVNFYTVGWLKTDSTPSPSGVFIVDLPGYGYAKTAKSERERFGELTERYLGSGRIKLLVQLIDFRHPPTDDDLIMLKFLKESGIPFIIALTKADKLRKKQRSERRAALEKELPYDDLTIIEFSAETGEGVPELRKIIESEAYRDIQTVSG